MRQGDGNNAADTVDPACLIQHFALKNAQKVEKGNFFHAAVFDCADFVVGDIARGKRAVKAAVGVQHRNAGKRAVRLQDVPCVAQRNGGRERGRRIESEVAHLRAHRLDQHRRLCTESVEQVLRFVA